MAGECPEFVFLAGLTLRLAGGGLPPPQQEPAGIWALLNWTQGVDRARLQGAWFRAWAILFPC